MLTELKVSAEYRRFQVDMLVPEWVRTLIVAVLILGGGLFLGAGLAFGQQLFFALGQAWAALGFLAIWFELFLRLAPSLSHRRTTWVMYLDRESFKLLAQCQTLSTGGLTEVIAKTKAPVVNLLNEILELTGNDYAAVAKNSGGESLLAIVDKATKQAKARGDAFVRPHDLILSLLKESAAWQEVLKLRLISNTDIEGVSEWLDARIQERIRARHFWEPASYRVFRPLGLNWSSGYTPTLDQYSGQLFNTLETERKSVVVHPRQLNDLEDDLARDSINNVLLVGDVGVGKNTLLRELARRVNFGHSLDVLNFKRVLRLDLEGLLSGSSDPAIVRNRLISVFNEAVAAGNVIIVIKDLDTFVGVKNIIGTGDLTEILVPYLESPRFQIVATASTGGYRKHIEPATRLNNLFLKVGVDEPSPEATQKVLLDLAIPDDLMPCISLRAIRKVVELADQYFMSERRPQKAVQLLEDILGHRTKQSFLKMVEPQDVEVYFSRRLGFNVGLGSAQERERLLMLENQLHQRVIGQDEAVTLISSALRRTRAGVQNSKRPVGSFLFIGPTGVGKTEVSKALAEVYFGSEENMIRFDMSEFQELGSLASLIGAAAGNVSGRLTEAVKNKPMSLILLDEIEKAHKDLLNIFLQILDEGRIQDGLGDTIWFSNCIIIATSNAGSEFIRENIQSVEYAHLGEEVVSLIQKQGIFRPEFINRFDAVVPFHPLSIANVKEVARLMLDNFAEHMADSAGISLEYDDDVVDFLAGIGYKPEFGARPMRRALQESIESFIANKILKSELKTGSHITVKAEDLKA